jgi:NADPH2:quinone reductase
LYVEGKLKPHVSNVLPFAEANTALDLLRTRQATGKIVIEVSK